MRLVFFTLTAVALMVSGLTLRIVGAADELPRVELNVDSIAPRPIEDLTERNIARDYARAWATLSAALAQNRADLLDNYFVGFARDKFAQAIAEQRKTGVDTRYFDQGHKLEAYFYAPEGDAMQLRDRPQLRIQVLDGNKVIHEENVTLRYEVLMTPDADRWKVRLLQAVPEF